MTTNELQTLISERFPNLATSDRDLEAATVVARRDEMHSIVAAGAGAADFRQHETQAVAYLERPADEHVREGLAHHVFNVLRGATDSVDGAGFADVLAALVAMGV